MSLINNDILTDNLKLYYSLNNTKSNFHNKVYSPSNIDEKIFYNNYPNPFKQEYTPNQTYYNKLMSPQKKVIHINNPFSNNTFCSPYNITFHDNILHSNQLIMPTNLTGRFIDKNINDINQNDFFHSPKDNMNKYQDILLSKKNIKEKEPMNNNKIIRNERVPFDKINFSKYNLD